MYVGGVALSLDGGRMRVPDEETPVPSDEEPPMAGTSIAAPG